MEYQSLSLLFCLKVINFRAENKLISNDLVVLFGDSKDLLKVFV